MRIAEVVGTVTLSSCHPSLKGKRLKLVTPLSLANLTGEDPTPSAEIVVLDELGAGEGCRIAMSEGAEAAAPYYPDPKPVDAYNAAILDSIDIQITVEKPVNDK